MHHFRAIDYVIDTVEEELTEDIIKNLHYILKHDIKNSTLSWFAVGDYKKRANVVGGQDTFVRLLDMLEMEAYEAINK